MTFNPRHHFIATALAGLASGPAAAEPEQNHPAFQYIAGLDERPGFRIRARDIEESDLERIHHLREKFPGVDFTRVNYIKDTFTILASHSEVNDDRNGMSLSVTDLNQFATAANFFKYVLRPWKLPSHIVFDFNGDANEYSICALLPPHQFETIQLMKLPRNFADDEGRIDENKIQYFVDDEQSPTVGHVDIRFSSPAPGRLLAGMEREGLGCAITPAPSLGTALQAPRADRGEWVQLYPEP